MLRATKEWDIRIPKELIELFPKSSRRGWWYKVSRESAQDVVNWLSNEYKIAPPKIDDIIPKGANGWYRSTNGGVISIWPRAHLKTVFHEFYHHLDFMTRGKYDSDDKDNLSWIYADKVWDRMKEITYK